MNPNRALTPIARAIRTEIIARPGTLFTRMRSYRDLNPGAPLIVDPHGDAAHLIAALRVEADTPADADAVLARIVAGLPRSAMDDLNVSREALRAALTAAEPARPVYEW